MTKMLSAVQRATWIWLPSVDKNTYAGFVRTLDLGERPAEARIGIFADVHYKLYINGRFVNAGPAPFRKPVITIDSLDVTMYLKPGRNTLFIMARHIGETVKYNTLGEPGVIAALVTRTSAGVESVVVTDKSWKGFAIGAWARETPKMTWALGGVEAVDVAHESFRTLAAFAGEDYASGGGDSGDVSAASLRPVQCRLEDKLEMRERDVPLLRWTPEPMPRVIHIFRMTPEIYSLRDNAMRLDSEYRTPVWEADEYEMLKGGSVNLSRVTGEKGFSVLYDFMRMSAGDFTVEIRSPGPATVDVAFAEHLRDGRPMISRNGSHYYARLHLVKGVNRFRLFNSNGFRFLYVVLKDFEGDLEISSLVVNECRADLDYKDSLTVADRAVMSIYAISRRAIMLNTQAEPYDCNTRERGTYWGDSLWVLESVGLMTGNFSHLLRLCEAMNDEYAATGMLNGSLYGMGEPLYDYSLVPVEMVRRYYLSTGDARGLARQIETCGKIVQDFRRLKDSRGLIMLGAHPAGEGRHGLLFLDHPGLGWHPRTTTGVRRDDCSAGINLFYLQALQALEELHQLTGLGVSLKGEIQDLQSRIYHTFYVRERGLLADCRDDSKGCFGYSQIVNALGVMTGVLAGGEAIRAVRESIDVERNPWISQGSPYSYFFIADAVKRIGFPQWGLQTIRQYWIPMLERGATTTWEAFGGEHHDSFCHAWSAPLPYLVFKGLMGLEPLEPGYKAIRLEPALEAYDAFDASCCIPGGVVRVNWCRKSAGAYAVRIEAPPSLRVVLVTKAGETGFTGSSDQLVAP